MSTVYTTVTLLYKQLSCWCDSRSYCLRRTV